MRSIFTYDRYCRRKRHQEDQICNGSASDRWHSDCKYPGNYSDTSVFVLWHTEGVNITSNSHDAERGKAECKRDYRRTLYERLEGKVLVVIVDHKDKAKNIYGTVTHNRARGTHLLEPMKKIVKELRKQLGMRPEEIFRLSDFSKEDFLKMMTKGVTGYSKAEFITKI